MLLIRCHFSRPRPEEKYLAFNWHLEERAERELIHCFSERLMTEEVRVTRYQESLLVLVIQAQL